MIQLSGVLTAIVTPFSDDYKIDHKAFGQLVKWQMDNGISGIIVSGSTGESATLNDNELSELIKAASRTVKGNMPIIANVGSNCTLKTIQKIKIAENFGADMIMVVVPYYNKPTQKGIYEHFSLIARSTTLPIILYNCPGRCIVNMEVDTIEKLLDFKNIIGIKESANDINRFAQLSKLSNSFAVLCGDDCDALSSRSLGAKGVASVVSNLLPDIAVKLQQHCNQNRYDLALDIHNTLANINRLMFVESNPIPVKYAMSKIGLCKNILRLPLTSLNEKYREELDAELANFYDL